MKKLVIRYLIIAMTTAVPVALWAPPVEACGSCPSFCPPACQNFPGVDTIPGIGNTFLDQFFVPGGGSYGQGLVGPEDLPSVARFNNTGGGGSSNTLWGDYFHGGTDTFGQGGSLVHVEPGPGGQPGSGGYTFYGQYTSPGAPDINVPSVGPGVPAIITQPATTTPTAPVDPATVPRVRSRRDGEILDVYVEVPKTGQSVRFNSRNRASVMMEALEQGASWEEARRQGSAAPRYAQDERASDSQRNPVDWSGVNSSMAELKQEHAGNQAAGPGVAPAGTDALDNVIDSAVIEIQDTPPAPAGPPRPAGFTPSTRTITLANGQQIQVQDGINLNGSLVVKSHGERNTLQGKFTIYETADGKFYGVDDKGNNKGPMHESRNQPFPDQKQFSFDDGYPLAPPPANQSAGVTDDQASVPTFQDEFERGDTSAWDNNL